MAFIGSAAALPLGARPAPLAVSARTSAFTAARVAPPPPAAAPARLAMMAGKPPNRFDNKVASTQDKLGAPSVAQGSTGKGFTRMAEIINGRYAMIGFIAGLAVELGTGRSIYEQVKLPLELVTKVLQ